MAPDRNCTFENRIKVGAFQKISFSIKGIHVGEILGKTVPKKIRDLFGLIKHDEVDIILDASGFAYGDHWGLNILKNRAKAYRKSKKRGAKIVLLPQAFGEFTSDKMKKHFKEIVEVADLIFPRDDISYKCVTELVGVKDSIIKSPDFTNIISLDNSVDVPTREGIAIIPNYRMLDKTTLEERDRYIPLLIKCISILESINQNMFFLIHEGDQDLRIAEEINKQIENKIPVVKEEDPLIIKKIIGDCRGVISSRYHGIISSLCQGVITIGIGWSHKYSELFREYGVKEDLIESSISYKELEKKLNIFQNEAEMAKLRDKINDITLEKKQYTRNMWNIVFSKLGI